MLDKSTHGYSETMEEMPSPRSGERMQSRGSRRGGAIEDDDCAMLEQSASRLSGSRNTDEESEVDKDLFVVFIKGFISDKGVQSYPQECVPPYAKVINVYPSSVGSIHDRVCEVFYELIGGRVDYGEEHSSYHGHDRFGREFSQGLLPQWDEDHPIIVIGHSFGGLTAYALQTYLEEKRFASHPHTNHRWVKGLVTVCSPLNGSLRVYVAGLHVASPWMLYWGTIGHLLMILVHVLEYWQHPWLLKAIHDFDQGFWKYHHSYKHSLLTLLLSFAGFALHSQNDSIAYDSGLDAVGYWSRHITKPFPDTFYYSISGTCTPDEQDTLLFHESFPTRSPLLHALRQKMYKYRLAQQLAPKRVLGGTVDTKHWLDSPSDGMVSLFTQQFPRFYSDIIKPRNESDPSQQSDRGSSNLPNEEGPWILLPRLGRDYVECPETTSREEDDNVTTSESVHGLLPSNSADDEELEERRREAEEIKKRLMEEESNRPPLEVNELRSFEEHALLQPGVWNYVTMSLTHYCLTSECSRLWLLIWYTCQVIHEKAILNSLSSSQQNTQDETDEPQRDADNTREESQQEQSCCSRSQYEIESVGKDAYSGRLPPSPIFDHWKPDRRPISLTLYDCHRVGSEYYGAWSEHAFVITYLILLAITVFAGIGPSELFQLSPSPHLALFPSPWSEAQNNSDSWWYAVLHAMMKAPCYQLIWILTPYLIAGLIYFSVFRKRCIQKLTTAISHWQVLETTLLTTRLFALILSVMSLSLSSSKAQISATEAVVTNMTVAFGRELVWSILFETFIAIVFFLRRRQYTMSWHKVLSIIILWQASSAAALSSWALPKVSSSASSVGATFGSGGTSGVGSKGEEILLDAIKTSVTWWALAIGSHLVSQLIPLILWIACSLKPAEHWSLSAISWGWILLVGYWLLCLVVIVSLCSLFSLWLAAHCAFVPESVGESVIYWISSLLGWYGLLGLAYNSIDSYSFGLCYVLIKKEFHHERYREASEASASALAVAEGVEGVPLKATDEE